MPIAVGSKAPDFTLKTKTAEGLKDIKLSDNFGKKQTLLLFFPLAYTGTCTQEMCDVSGGLGQYSGLSAEVYGISVDSPFSQEAWAKQNSIKVTLLSDLNNERDQGLRGPLSHVGGNRRYRGPGGGGHRKGRSGQARRVPDRDPESDLAHRISTRSKRVLAKSLAG